MKRTILATVAAATLALIVGCGSTSTGTRHNDADVAFAQMMIPHHEQAIEMSKLAATRASSADVRELAGAIEAAQDPEIQTMRGWLRSWGEDDAMGHNDGHDMSGDMSRDMPGMMSEKTMAELKQAKGAEFDRLFLTSMIAHHEGAIDMAREEKADGEFPGTLSLADAIMTTQAAEIERMRAMLK